MVECEYGGQWEANANPEEAGMPVRHCALLAELTGSVSNRGRRENCAACSGADDGGWISAAAVELLGARITMRWETPEACVPCGSSISLEEAIVRLKARIGGDAANALVQAALNGMPEEMAGQLRARYFAEMP